MQKSNSLTLHAFGDTPVFESDLKIAQIFASWFFVSVLINSGLKQVTCVIQKEDGKQPVKSKKRDPAIS